MIDCCFYDYRVITIIIIGKRRPYIARRDAYNN